MRVVADKVGTPQVDRRRERDHRAVRGPKRALCRVGDGEGASRVDVDHEARSFGRGGMGEVKGRRVVDEQVETATERLDGLLDGFVSGDGIAKVGLEGVCGRSAVADQLAPQLQQVAVQRRMGRPCQRPGE